MSEADFGNLSDDELARLLATENAQETEDAIAAAPVTYAWDETSGSYLFSLVDQQNFLEVHYTQPGSAYVENLSVDERYQRRGFARRMLLGAAALFSHRGVQAITSNSWTPEALQTIEATFGEDVITVFDAENRNASSNPAFAMTLAQAALSSERARTYNQAHPESELPTLIGATIDISNTAFAEDFLPQKR